MVNQPHLDLKHIIDALRSENSRCRVHAEKVKLYDITPREFLSFARQDLEEESERGRINALSNAKRAIECRVDEFLTLSNLRFFSSLHRWGLRYKMEVLKTFGVSAPDVLMNYIVSRRNLLEHEYTRPKSPEETKYVADIAELFLSATDKYIENGYISSATISRRDEGQWQRSARMNTRTDYEEEYKLTFDLENEVVVVTFKQLEHNIEWVKRTSELRDQAKAVGEQSVNTIAIRDCKEADLRELMKLIREKAD